MFSFFPYVFVSSIYFIFSTYVFVLSVYFVPSVCFFFTLHMLYFQNSIFVLLGQKTNVILFYGNY
ncbi:hypothetical protein BD779DRAFT_1574635, partial [Infundibulicybe gibba]